MATVGVDSMNAHQSKPVATHQTCPRCKHNDCLTIFSDGKMKCHSQDCYKDDWKMESNNHQQQYQQPELEERSVEWRAQSVKAQEKYGITTKFDKKTGEAYARTYPYPHKDKVRIVSDGVPKAQQFKDNQGFTNDHLFGMDKFNAGSSKYLTIVEGEEDVPSAYQMLGEKFPVVGIPGASISNSLLKNCHDYIDAFEYIIVATDADQAGDKAAERLAAAFPNKVYRVNLTKHNDPNAYLQAGDTTEFFFAWTNRVKYVPEFDTSTPDAFLELFHSDSDDEYIPTGIDAYDAEHLGLFQGHLTMFQAPEGTGKTELFHYFEHHLIKNHPDIPFASCHLEETKLRTTLGWVSYDLQENLTRKDLITDTKSVEASIQRLTANENAHLFKVGTDEDPLILLDRVRYYATVCGCKYIFIEPIQDLAQQYTGSETTERFLSKIAVQLARIASDLGVGIVIIAHENDEGLVSDCRKLSKMASVVVRLERDIENTDPEIRNTTTLKSKKNRPTGFTGYGGQLLFDASKFTLEEKY